MALDANPTETLKEIVAEPVMIQGVNIERQELDKAVALKGRQETTAEVQSGRVDQHITQEALHTQLGHEGAAQAQNAITDTTYHAGVSAAETHSMLADDANVRAHSAESQSQTAYAAAEGLKETVRVRQAVSEESEKLVMVQQEVARRTAAEIEDRTPADVTTEKESLEAVESTSINNDLENQLIASAEQAIGGPKV